MTSKKIRSLFIASAMFILVLALGFSSILSTGSFEKSLTESYVSSFVLNGGESVRKIEYALKYGKQIDKFFGIQSILEEVRANSVAIKNVMVITSSGRIAYSLETNKTDNIPVALQASLKQMLRTGKETSWQVLDHQYNVLLLVRDPAGVPVGAMDIMFDETVIAPQVSSFQRSIMLQTMVVGLIAALALALILMRMAIVDLDTGRLRNRQLLTAILIVIAVAQIFLTAGSIRQFQPVYLSSVQSNHALVGQLVKKNIEKVVAKGVPYSALQDLDKWLDSVLVAMPEIESVTLADSNSKPLYSTRRVDASQYLSQLNPVNATQVELVTDGVGAKAVAIVALSMAHIESKNRAIIIDALTLLVTTILFSVEILLFLGIFFHHKAKARTLHANEQSLSGIQNNIAIVRPQAFVFFLGVSMTASFLPIILQNYEPIFGLPENLMLGLPLTVEILASIGSTLVTGAVLDRRGWRPPFIMGLLVLAVGTLLSAISSSTIVFLFARTIVGVGYGFAWMSLRGFVAHAGTERDQTIGFAAMNSGILAGINCGIVLGAMLVERMSYSGIFWISLVLTGIALFFCFVFTANRIPAVVHHHAANSKQALRNLLVNRDILIFFVTIAMPTAICLMFLNYFVPVYAKSIGITPADVGRMFLLYGLCVVYLGPIISKSIIHKYSFKLSNGLSFLLIISGLVLFGFFPSPVTCTVAVLLLGISDGLGMVAQNNYYLTFDSVKEFGVGKSMGIFSIVKKTGQTMGPSIFGWLSISSMGIGMLGIVFFGALILYMLLAPQQKKSVSASSG